MTSIDLGLDDEEALPERPAEQTVSNWVQDIELRQGAEKQAVIYRLRALGWTRKEIGEVAGLTRRRVGQKLEDLENCQNFQSLFSTVGTPSQMLPRSLR